MFAEVRCGARWDGTPRCENWLGQEVDMNIEHQLGSTHYIEGTGYVEILSKNVLIFIASGVKVFKFLNV